MANVYNARLHMHLLIYPQDGAKITQTHGIVLPLARFVELKVDRLLSETAISSVTNITRSD